jgi:aspartate/methionine/tyrosine aminotransferase
MSRLSRRITGTSAKSYGMCDKAAAYSTQSGLGLAYPAQHLAERILESAHVVVEAGSFYGAAGEGHLRLCFGSPNPTRSLQRQWIV